MPDDTPPELVVVIVTHNSGDVVAECLRALPAALEGCGAVRVVMVDNASTDGTVEAVRLSFPHVLVVETGANVGYAAAINRGAHAAAAPSAPLLVLNPDICLRPGSVRQLIAALSDPAVGVAVPRLLTPEGRTAWSLRREPRLLGLLLEALLGGPRAGRLGLGELVVGAEAYERDHDADWATGAAWLLSARCRALVGEWDETFLLYSEETDYALRARDAGFTVRFCAGAEAVHRGGEAMTNPALYALMTWNRVRAYARRHPRGAVAFRAVMLLGELLRSVRRRPTHRAAVRALLTGRAGLPGADRGWVCLAAVDWWYHNQAHSELQLMKSLAQDEPVLVVNSIGVRAPVPGRTEQFTRRVTRKLRSMSRPLTRPLADLPNFAVMTPFFLPVYGTGRAAAVNSWLIRWQVLRAARAMGMHHPACLVTVPTAAPVVERAGFRHVVFNRSDKHSELPGADQALIGSFEEVLLRRADHVVYVSRALMAEDSALVGERAVFLDHGVDLDHFRRTEVPHELADLPRPVVGFFGGINSYTVDVSLLERVAREVDATLLLAGDVTTDASAFIGLPNVRWLGQRPYAEIPGIGSAFDVAIMPWQDNEWIRRCNPIKLKEYLALGLPVVTMYYPEVERYEDLVLVARDPDEFISLVRRALDGAAGGDAQAGVRRRSVLDASWDSRAAILSDLARRSA